MHNNDRPVNSAVQPQANASANASFAYFGSGFLKACLASALIAALLFAMILAWGIIKTGSFGAALAYLDGDYVYAVAEGPPLLAGGISKQTVLFENLSNEPIRIVGYHGACSCVIVAGLPITIAPHTSGAVSTSATAPDKSREVELGFMTDVPAQGTVHFSLSIPAKSAIGG